MYINTAYEIGLLVREQRLAEGITREELARGVDATRQWVWHLESGLPCLELGLMLRALKALRIRIDLELPQSGSASNTSVPQSSRAQPEIGP